MQLPRRILIGIDFESPSQVSRGSRAALDQGLALARAANASVTLFHANVADESWDGDVDRFVSAEALAPEQSERALAALLEAQRPSGLEIRVACGDDRADRAIIRQVLAEDSELVLVGRRSRQDAPHLPLGSISRRLVHHCPCLVWVVKEPRAELPRAILAGTDLSPVGVRVLETSLVLARRAEAALHVVHAFQLPFEVQMEGDEAVLRFEREAAAAARAVIAKDLEQLGGYAGAKIHVGRTSPAAALLGAARRFEVDLAVMGTVSRGGLPGLVLGNTAERLLDRLACSILAVKPADFVCALAR